MALDSMSSCFAEQNLDSWMQELLYRYIGNKTIEYIENEAFLTMVYGIKNVSFHPLNPFPALICPTRPSPTKTLFDGLNLGNYSI